jgi:hypothetical protein
VILGDGVAEVFREQIGRCVRLGLEAGASLRRFDDWAEAKRSLLFRDGSGVWRSWDRAMACYATWDSRAAAYFDQFVSWRDVAHGWSRDFIDGQRTVFGSVLNDYPAAQALIGETVAFSRAGISERGDLAGFDPGAYRFEAPPPGSVPEVPVGRPGWRKRWQYRKVSKTW